MNLYFVFEGKTEPIVYKKWFSVLLPDFSEVDSYDAVKANNYYYESDMGMPDCYNVAANAIQEINEVQNYDYLVLFIDADRYSVEEKKEEAFRMIQEKLDDPQKNYAFKGLPENCKLTVIIQKVCIETWFLGNRKFFVRNPQSEKLKKYIEYFDVSKSDPEDLANEFEQSEDGTNQIFGYATKALFHEGYLREIFKERLGRGYRKSKPKEVQENTYLQELIKRKTDNSDHLLSFQEMLQFCSKIQLLVEK